MSNTRLTVISSICIGGKCPTAYRSDDGRLFIQGYKVDDSLKGTAGLPPGEDMVEISQELLDSLKR